MRKRLAGEETSLSCSESEPARACLPQGMPPTTPRRQSTLVTRVALLQRARRDSRSRCEESTARVRRCDSRRTFLPTDSTPQGDPTPLAPCVTRRSVERRPLPKSSLGLERTLAQRSPNGELAGRQACGWPVRERHRPDQALARHCPPRARVTGVSAVVAEEEVVPGPDARPTAVARTPERRIDVGLAEPLSVDQDGAPPLRDQLAGEPHDALHERRRRRHRIDTARPLEERGRRRSDHAWGRRPGTRVGWR